MSGTEGPIILWTDYGTEGWKPASFATLKEALEAPRYGTAFVITKAVNYEVIERQIHWPQLQQAQQTMQRAQQNSNPLREEILRDAL